VYTASAQFADFRLAKLEPDAHIHVMTHVMGTFGYLVAECTASGKLPEKSDVYSFGVVLLQLITGHKPVDTRQPIRGESLVEWARPLMTVVLEDRNNVEPLVDPELGEDYDKKEIFCMIEAAAACVFHTASMHPKMSEVSQMIHLKT
jgi:serine/threonine protein kinase